jgi:HEAT repeat protein
MGLYRFLDWLHQKKIFGPLNVEKLVKKGNVKRLIKTLRYINKNELKIVIEALGKSRDIRAVNPLSEILKNEDIDIRKKVIEALTQIGTPAINPLYSIFQNSSTDIRRRITKALGIIYRNCD